jgi:glycosyltransferase involved in cell wall biosynthesis
VRITFVLATLQLSGGNRVIAIYTRALAQRGHDISIVLSRPSRSLRSRFEEWTLRRPPDVREVEDQLDYGPVRMITIEGAGRRAIAQVPDADVVIATWWETAELVDALPASKGRHAYLIQHHETFDYLPVARVERTYRMPMLQIVVSRWLEGVMRDRYGSPAIVCVPNAVDTAQFFAPPRGRQSVPTVGFVHPGSTGWKGGDLMVEACIVARRQVPDLRVVLFGKEQPAAPLPAGFELVIRPPQDAIRELYSSCDVWLFGSTSEGFGLPVLEAMACRTPVIGTPAGAAPELIGDDAGQLVPFDDPAAMAQAIVDFARMPVGRWRQLSDCAYRRATSYGWDDAAGRLEQALKDH